MLFAKEIDGLICIRRYKWNEVTEWRPVTVGSKPTTYKISEQKYLIAFEFLSHIYYICLDPAVWLPFFANPFDGQGTFHQIKGALDLTAVGSQSSCACVAYPPKALIYLKVSGLYLTEDGLYTAYVSLDFSKFSTPFWCNGYRLYQRQNNGPWTMISDWAPDFQNFKVTEEGGWTSEFCVTWAWLYDPSAPNDTTAPHWLESDIDEAPVLDPPASPIAFARNFNETIRLGISNFNAATAWPKGEFLVSTATDAVVCGAADSSAVIAQNKGAFVTAPDGLEMVCASNKHDGSSVIGGIRG